MKWTTVVILTVAAGAIAAPKRTCDFKKEISKLEALFGTTRDMKGARTKSWKNSLDSSLTEFEKTSMPIESGERSALLA